MKAVASATVGCEAYPVGICVDSATGGTAALEAIPPNPRLRIKQAKQDCTSGKERRLPDRQSNKGIHALETAVFPCRPTRPRVQGRKRRCQRGSSKDLAYPRRKRETHHRPGQSPKASRTDAGDAESASVDHEGSGG